MSTASAVVLCLLFAGCLGFLLWMAYDIGYDRGWDAHTPATGYVRCGSPMCSDPHRAIFGRCACTKQRGHDGSHSCGDEFALSERSTERVSAFRRGSTERH